MKLLGLVIYKSGHVMSTPFDMFSEACIGHVPRAGSRDRLSTGITILLILKDNVL